MEEGIISRRTTGVLNLEEILLNTYLPDYAIINITAPVNSSITFIKDGIIVKTLGPQDSHVNAINNALAHWYYFVAESNFGEWAIKAILEDDEATQTITIEAAEQYEVVLEYALYLVKNGKCLYKFSGDGSVSEVSSTVDYALFQTHHASWAGVLSSETPVNPAEYNTLVFDILKIAVGYNYSYVGLYGARNGGSALVTKIFSEGSSTSQRTEIRLDISKITATVGYPSTSIREGSFQIRNLYLEK